MYILDMPSHRLRIGAVTFGTAYHAALVDVRSGPTEEHDHADFYELMGVVAGHGEHRLAAGTQQLLPGDVVLVRPTDSHSMRGLPPTGVQFVNIAFPASAWRAFVPVAAEQLAERLDREPLPPRFELAGADARQAESAFRDALDCFDDKPEGLDLVRFWVAVLELITRSSVSDDTFAQPDWLVRACRAMGARGNLLGGVPRMVQLASVSHAHLARTVRAHYGKSPTQFITDLRLERAATLLSTTGMSVTEIAHACGFSSQSYFTRRFHQAHGVSPRAFRDARRRAVVP